MTLSPSYQLLWNQEFDDSVGTGVDGSFWRHDLGDGTDHGIAGWGNQEREWYLHEAAQQDGESCLRITATRQPDANPYLAYYGKPAEWTSAKITTYDRVSFQYGRMEARIKGPSGLGTWPAFWMLATDLAVTPWPQCGEIDIMESRGDMPSTLFGTLHGPGYFGDHGKGKTIDTGIDLSKDFHTYAVEWLPNKISWFFDDEKYAENSADEIAPLEWVYNKPFYVICNLAMGGHFTGPIDPQLNHAEMLIDYIRHYSIDGVGEVIYGEKPFKK